MNKLCHQKKWSIHFNENRSTSLNNLKLYDWAKTVPRASKLSYNYSKPSGCVVWCNEVPTIFMTSNIHQTDMWTPVITVKKDKWWSQILRRSILEFYLAQSGHFNESIAFCFAQMGTFNYKSIVFCWTQTETLTNQLHFILGKRNLNEFSFSKYFLTSR